MGSYSDLLTEVPKFLDLAGDKFMAVLPNIIRKAQVRMATELPITSLNIEQSDNFTAGSEYVLRPGLAFEYRYFEYDGLFGTIGLRQRSSDWIKQYWRIRSATGQPKYFADFDRTRVIITPTPDQAYTYRFAYRALPSLLSNSVQDNALTELYYECLLDACLAEGAKYAQDDRRSGLIEVWEQSYRDRKQTVISNERGRLLDAADNPPTEAAA